MNLPIRKVQGSYFFGEDLLRDTNLMNSIILYELDWKEGHNHLFGYLYDHTDEYKTKKRWSSVSEMFIKQKKLIKSYSFKRVS